MSQTHGGDDRGSAPSTPRWVKVFGIIVIVVVLLLGIIMLSGIGGQHGPGRHMPSGDTTRQTSLSSLIEDYTPPGAVLGGHVLPEDGYL